MFHIFILFQTLAVTDENFKENSKKVVWARDETNVDVKKAVARSGGIASRVGANIRIEIMRKTNPN